LEYMRHSPPAMDSVRGLRARSENGLWDGHVEAISVGLSRPNHLTEPVRGIVVAKDRFGKGPCGEFLVDRLSLGDNRQYVVDVALGRVALSAGVEVTFISSPPSGKHRIRDHMRQHRLYQVRQRPAHPILCLRSRRFRGSLRHGRLLGPGRGDRLSWSTRFSRRPGSRRYFVRKFNSGRDIPPRRRARGSTTGEDDRSKANGCPVYASSIQSAGLRTAAGPRLRTCVDERRGDIAVPRSS